MKTLNTIELLLIIVLFGITTAMLLVLWLYPATISIHYSNITPIAPIAPIRTNYIEIAPIIEDTDKINPIVLVIASTIFWESRGEPMFAKRIVGTTIWFDADGESNKYISACLNLDRYPSWIGRETNINIMQFPVIEINNSEYNAWQDCVKIAFEMVNKKFVPIGIYDSKKECILYPINFHATDGKRRTWIPKNTLKVKVARQTYYFKEIK